MAQISIATNRPGVSRTSGQAPGATAPLLIFLLVFSILWPGSFFLADLRLTPVRLLLLVSFVPLIIMLLSGYAGRLRSVDVLMMTFMLWVACTLFYHHGSSRLPYVTITIVETFGGYLVGRVLIRNPTDYRQLLKFMLWALILLFPLTIVELLFDRNLLQEISSKLMSTLQKGESTRPRLGLHRVMSGFEHAILYGLFCAVAFAPLLALYDKGLVRRLALGLFLIFMTFASLSSAPFLAIAIQIGLLIWAWINGRRWWTLIGIVAVTYVTVDLLSNRTPITILINYISFDVNTAWTRVHIWNFGSAEMWRHPFFGIGLNDWTRPDWLSPSIDNFWLLIGVRHGVVGVLLLITALSVSLWAVAHARNLPDEVARWRTAYVISMMSVFVTLCTVHIWGGTSSFVMLLVGAGVWFCNQENNQEAWNKDLPVDNESDRTRLTATRYSRFDQIPALRVSRVTRNGARQVPDEPQ